MELALKIQQDKVFVPKYQLKQGLSGLVEKSIEGGPKAVDLKFKNKHGLNRNTLFKLNDIIVSNPKYMNIKLVKLP